jgi:hypothetical protein
LYSSRRQKRFYLLRIDWEWTFALTIGTITNLEFSSSILIEWTKRSIAFCTIKLDILELRENAAPTRYDAGNTNEVVEMGSTEVTESGGKGKVRNADVNFRMNAGIAREIHKDSTQSHLVKYLKHSRRRVGKEISQDRFG